MDTIVMITVNVGDTIKCNTVGHRSAGLIGVLDRICDTEEDRKLGLGSDYGMVGDIAVNLHNCVRISKDIIVSISSVVDSDFGAWSYTHYCLFPDSHPTHRYSVRATLEGFVAMAQMWEKAGYKVIYQNEYPR